MKIRTLAAVALAAILGAIAGAGGFALYEHRQHASQAFARPAFVLPDLQDNPQSVTQWDGKVLVINFWATWCPPCVREIPMFVELQQEYGDQGLQIVGVALDRLDEIRTFGERLGINYPVLYGVQPAMEVGMAYGNDAGTLPYTVVVDRDGHVRHAFRTEVHRDELEPILRELL